MAGCFYRKFRAAPSTRTMIGTIHITRMKSRFVAGLILEYNVGGVDPPRREMEQEGDGARDHQGDCRERHREAGLSRRLRTSPGRTTEIRVSVISILVACGDCASPVPGADRFYPIRIILIPALFVPADDGSSSRRVRRPRGKRRPLENPMGAAPAGRSRRPGTYPATGAVW